MEARFPPMLEIGSRVWLDRSYARHQEPGPPNTAMALLRGGKVIDTEKPFVTMDQLLYAVKWDDGQISKHYAGELFCTGTFGTYAEFEAAIELEGEITLTHGPRGGFREALIPMKFDGSSQKVRLTDRYLWVNCLEPMAARDNIPVTTVVVQARGRVRGSG